MTQGVVISQDGIPIDQANDYQKALDSRWKFLDIAYEPVIDIVTQTFATTGWYLIKVFDHNLGYLPGFEVYPTDTPSPSDASPSNIFVADTQSIYYRVFFSTSFVSTNYRIQAMLRIYALDVTAEYQAPTVPPATVSSPTVQTIGAAFINQSTGGLIDSTDPHDYTLYTPVKSISIHKTGTATAVGGNLTITHNVAYPPTYLAAQIEKQTEWNSSFASPHPDRTIIRPLTTLGLGLVVASVNTLQAFGGPQSALPNVTYAYVILKDPVEIAQ